MSLNDVSLDNTSTGGGAGDGAAAASTSRPRPAGSDMDGAETSGVEGFGAAPYGGDDVNLFVQELLSDMVSFRSRVSYDSSTICGKSCK